MTKGGVLQLHSPLSDRGQILFGWMWSHFGTTIPPTVVSRPYSSVTLSREILVTSDGVEEPTPQENFKGENTSIYSPVGHY